MKKKTETGNAGFSLVELIIVIAIMAILVGVIAPQLIKFIEKANVSSDTETLNAVYTAIVYASMDPEVLEDDDSLAILANWDGSTAFTLESIENAGPSKLRTEILTTLGWPDLSQATYQRELVSTHTSGATIYFQNRGTAYNPLVMWITTTDSSGAKDTSYAPTNFLDPDVAKCVNVM